MDEIAPDAEAWAIAHDFTPTESEPNGATPLLREGMMGIAATSYAGYVLGRDATLYEFSVGSPTVRVENSSTPARPASKPPSEVSFSPCTA